jgi:alkanesulfonate monooxygenase SsuD/methylene tetrahydromethanopterin reductase-like flavin-dependent oxidoreductase (luciferase family)
MTVPLSILDLSPISEGSDAATALHNTIDLAQHAERWGYKRYWIAEHHFVAVASSSPAVLIGQIAAATERIHVGAGAVQLGHTTAPTVVESFAMLDAFYPGRIDLGVGRSGQRRREAAKKPADNAESAPKPKRELPTEWRDVGGVVVPPPFDIRTIITDRLRAQMSVLQQPEAVSPDFADQVDDILAMLHGCYRVGDYDMHAVPGERTTLTPWIFGSSKGQSAQVAGANGLPFVASYHITPATALDAVDAYRAAFTPSAALSEPYVVVSADVVVADDTDTAKHLASTYGHWVYSVRKGGGAAPYPDPDTSEPLTEEHLAVVKDRTATQFVGDADTVADKLETLQRVTAADELVVTSVTHRHDDRLRSHELIAKRWGIG